MSLWFYDFKIWFCSRWKWTVWKEKENCILGFHSNMSRIFAEVWFYYMVLFSVTNRSVWHCEFCFTFYWALSPHGNINSNLCNVQIKAIVFSDSLCTQFNFSTSLKFYSPSIFIEWRILVKKAATFSVITDWYEKHIIIYKVWNPVSFS